MSTSNYYYQHPQIYSPTGISEFLSQKTLCDMATHKIIDERAKGQKISKGFFLAEDSPKKRTNEFVFTSMRRVFVCFLGESSARKKPFEII